MSEHLQKIDSLRDNSEFLFTVCMSSLPSPLPPAPTNIAVYRGHWCHFCQSYLKSLAGLESSIKAAGGQTVIVTAETENFLPDVRAATGYKGEAINDPSNTIVAEFKKRGLVDVAISEKKGYAHGLAQPAVVVVKKDGTVLESWAIVPSMVSYLMVMDTG